MNQPNHKKLNILSLFDGISCARVALERAKIGVGAYFASEIDKYAIEISKSNYGDIIHIGDVKSVRETEFTGIKIDLLIGGSPCQDLSIAKTGRKGLAGERSGLFWEYARILKAVKPKYFILENVASMPNEAKEIISKELGVEPIMINAALVSAQNRKRLFWTNIQNIEQPQDRGIFLKDILESGETNDLKSLCITASYHKKNERDFLKKRSGQMIQVGDVGGSSQSQRVYDPEGKSVALSAGGGGMGAKTGLYEIKLPANTKQGYVTARERQDGISLSFPNSKTRRGRVIKDKSPTLQTTNNIGVLEKSIVRKLSPIECERLQGLPDDYTAGISNTQRYKTLGNAFNVDVIAHILSYINSSQKQGEKGVQNTLF